MKVHFKLLLLAIFATFYLFFCCYSAILAVCYYAALINIVNYNVSR